MQITFPIHMVNVDTSLPTYKIVEPAFEVVDNHGGWCYFTCFPSSSTNKNGKSKYDYLKLPISSIPMSEYYEGEWIHDGW